jgi:ABC-type nickel/cobalt efflux system permease component RcnA
MDWKSIRTKAVAAVSKAIRSLFPTAKEPIPTIQVTLYLLILLGLTFLTIHAIDPGLSKWLLAWYVSDAPAQDARDLLLLAQVGIAVTTWTGALIAFQLRGASYQINGIGRSGAWAPGLLSS